MGFDWVASPACTELEVITLDWLASFLNLPDKFKSSSGGRGGGVIQGSAGESATVVILAAVVKKKRQLEQIKGMKEVYREKMVVYCSDQTHAIIEKSTMILGIQVRKIQTLKKDNFALQPEALAKAIAEDKKNGLIPCACVATTGTTSSCAFDPVASIAKVCKENEIWLHIDAAYGGAYACLEDHRHLFKGVEDSDSFCVNCHKKLLCPFDIAALYVADRVPILDALSLSPEYLKNDYSTSGAVVDYEHWQMPLGRRFRSLKLWFVMRRFGTEGMREHVQRGVNLAKYFETLVASNPNLELEVPVSLSLVCFRWKGRDDADQMRLLAAVKATGDCFIIHTGLGGRKVLRLACGGIEQSESDVKGAYDVIKRELDKLL